MIAVTFALSDESRDFSRVLREAGRTGPHGFPAVASGGGLREVIVLHTGMGADRTRERLPKLLEGRSPKCVISAGYAGGLDPLLPSGSLVCADNYSSPELLASAKAILQDRLHTGTMITCAATLETPEAKAHLAKATRAIAVDMETAAIAELCRERGVPLLSVRVISDAANEELAVPFSVCFDARTERPRICTLLTFLTCRPWRIPRFIRFVRTVGRARCVLTKALVELAGRL